MSEKKSSLTIVKRKKKRHLKEILSDNKKNFIIGIIAFVILLFAYFGSSISKISNIDVVGVNELGEQQVINSSKISNNTLVLSIIFNSSKYRNSVKKDLESVKDINFHIISFNRLKISVKEYETVGYLSKNSKYNKILSTGKVVSKGSKVPIGNYPVYSNFKNKSMLDMTIREFGKSNSKIKHSISEIKYSPSKLNKYRIRLFMNDGNEVIADIRTMKKKLEYYPSIVSQMKQKGIVDLEIGAYSHAFS
ncbi:cell division protein FtsQ/DivIB [Companilactobacillus sp. DQM5]|uniref:cell division protein FtsQ/DivIB n=1 Tax=Companilactobacillus sp. DQM5 TaxID=3463359 RepID=UPI00405934A2